MIIYLNTSTPTCFLAFTENGWSYETTWESGRGLALGLLEFLDTQLAGQGKGWQDVTGLVIFKGPGSFTGLRIGITVFNTLAATNAVPIIGATGDDWQKQGMARILAGENDKIVLPEYGGEANITTPRK